MRYQEKRDSKGHFIVVIKSRVKICKFCGKDFTPSGHNFRRNKFCSPSCASKSHPSGRTGKVGGQHQKDMVRLKLSGKNHWKWIENRTEALEKHRIRGMIETKNWRNKVFLRDNFTCQICGLRDEEIMEVDHIRPKAIAPELYTEPTNLICICPNCHRRKTNRDIKIIIDFKKGIIN